MLSQGTNTVYLLTSSDPLTLLFGAATLTTTVQSSKGAVYWRGCADEPRVSRLLTQGRVQGMRSVHLDLSAFGLALLEWQLNHGGVGEELETALVYTQRQLRILLQGAIIAQPTWTDRPQ